MVDRALDTSAIHGCDAKDGEDPKLYLEEARMSGSLVHDIWSKMKNRTTTSSVGGSVDYCIRVPMYVCVCVCVCAVCVCAVCVCVCCV